MGFSKAELEKAWGTFQLNVSSLRRTLGPFFNTAGHGRKRYEFLAGHAPEGRGYRMAPGATVNQPNGIPDIFGVDVGGSFSGRLDAVIAAGTIIITFDSLVQAFSAELGQPRGFQMDTGEQLPRASGLLSGVRTSTFLHALANHHRHVDEWAFEAEVYLNPRTQFERRQRYKQERSMRPLAAVLGCPIPITNNVTFDGLEALMAPTNDYYKIEWHVLRIGQDVVIKAGFDSAQIGLTKVDEISESALSELTAEQKTIISGPGHAAD